MTTVQLTCLFQGGGGTGEKKSVKKKKKKKKHPKMTPQGKVGVQSGERKGKTILGRGNA